MGGWRRGQKGARQKRETFTRVESCQRIVRQSSRSRSRVFLVALATGDSAAIAFLPPSPDPREAKKRSAGVYLIDIAGGRGDALNR
jgi:hypothetical protein